MSYSLLIKEQNFRRKISDLKSKGHWSIEARRKDENVWYSCVVCKSEFKFNKDLIQHLKEDSHRVKLNFAQTILLKENPFPFNDGVGFYHDPEADLTIPTVLCCGEIHHLKVDHIGSGIVMMREKAQDRRVKTIWCEWTNSLDVGEHHDFGIVVFPWSFTLGRFSSIGDLVDKAVKGAKTIKTKDLKKNMVDACNSRCTLCYQPFLPGIDVGAILRNRNGVLVCNSMMLTDGIFHVYHVSCLISWILLWDCERHENEGLHTVFCPVCRGTGLGARLNVPAEPVPVSGPELMEYKKKLSVAIDNWEQNPEIVERSSTGLCFPDDDDPPQGGEVKQLPSLKFYRARRSG